MTDDPDDADPDGRAGPTGTPVTTEPFLGDERVALRAFERDDVGSSATP